MIHHGELNLWREVLLAQIEDAVRGVRGPKSGNTDRILQTKSARDFLTRQSNDLDIICTFAGIEADAFRERMSIQIAAAPSPEELLKPKRINNSPRQGRKLTYQGRTQTLSTWAEQHGLTHSLVNNRLRSGWTIEQALTPVHKKGVRAEWDQNEVGSKVSDTTSVGSTSSDTTKAVSKGSDNTKAGVGLDFVDRSGTGAGTSAQDSTKIDFPELEGAI